MELWAFAKVVAGDLIGDHMAQYEYLPIYKKAMDLAVYAEIIVRGFPRYHKYTIGSEMRALAHKIVVLVARANSEQDKKGALTESREALEELKILTRISKELKVFANFNSFECLVKMIVEVSGQNEGWLRSRNPVRGYEAPDRERAYDHGAPRPPGGGR